jgi:hypothetical protein
VRNMEYRCNSCREASSLSPKAKFCPVCGSTSLILVVKEQAEPAQKETVGVYNSATLAEGTRFGADLPSETSTVVVESEPDTSEKEEEDQPRRNR